MYVMLILMISLEPRRGRGNYQNRQNISIFYNKKYVILVNFNEQVHKNLIITAMLLHSILR